MQVGTSPYSAVSSGADYAFISAVAESPRIAPAIDLPATADRTDASPRRDQSLRGHTSEEAEDFPRHYPPAVASSLIEAAGEGFTVMSGSSHGVASVQGKSLTRQGISLGSVTFCDRSGGEP